MLASKAPGQLGENCTPSRILAFGSLVIGGSTLGKFGPPMENTWNTAGFDDRKPVIVRSQMPLLMMVNVLVEELPTRVSGNCTGLSSTSMFPKLTPILPVPLVPVSGISTAGVSGSV